MKAKLFSVWMLFFVLTFPMLGNSQNLCNPPSGLGIANLSTTGANISWVAPTGGLAYMLQYRPVTTPESAWTSVTTQLTSAGLTGLTCGTAYECHVAAYCSSTSGSMSAYSTSLNFITLACTEPCITPVGMATNSISATGATFNWTAVTGAVGYSVQYRPVTTPESAWTTVSATTNTLVLNNLVCGTAYQWHVASYCGTSTNMSAYSGLVNFTTLACAPPCNPPVDLLTTSLSATSATASWTAITGINAYTLQYRPVTTPESAWVTVSSTANSFVFTNLTCGTAYQWHVASNCGNVSGSSNGLSVYSGLVNFTTLACAPPCNPPADLLTNSLSTTSATASWTAITGINAYTLQYRPVTTPESAWVTVSCTTNSFVFTGLTCGTAYQWHVASNCGNVSGSSNGLSAYSGLVNFTTLACAPACNPPVDLLTTSLTTNGSTLTWTAVTGAAAYLIQYRPLTTPESVWTNLTSTTNSVTLANLACGTAYQWHVATYCTSSSSGTNTLSNYSPLVNFNTLACSGICNAPTGLINSNISTSGATLSWTSASGAAGYMVQYRPIITPESGWINVSDSLTSLTLSNLVCGTQYQWHVASNCPVLANPTGLSPYSVILNFSTLPCIAPCNAPTGLLTSNITTIGAKLNWTPVTGTMMYSVQYRKQTTPESAWINLTASGNSLILSNLLCGTQYQWRVACYCGTSTSNTAGLSVYSAPISFVTASCSTPCNPPSTLLNSNLTANGVTLSWVNLAGASSAYLLQYRPITIPESVWVNVTSQTNVINLSGLLCGTQYQWRVATYCGNSATGISAYSAVATFTTLPCPTNNCGIPTGLTSTSISTNTFSRMLNWNSTGAISYNIRYKKVGTLAYQTLTSAVNSKLIIGLQSGQYEWQVQSVCANNAGATSLSAWSSGSTFNIPLQIFPNPVNGNRMHVDMNSEEDINISVNINISDQYGNALKKYDAVLKSGPEGLDVDVSGLKNGIYFIHITGDAYNEMQKVIIMK